MIGRRLVAARMTALFAIMPCGSRCIVLANIAIELMTGKPVPLENRQMRTKLLWCGLWRYAFVEPQRKTGRLRQII